MNKLKMQERLLQLRMQHPILFLCFIVILLSNFIIILNYWFILKPRWRHYQLVLNQGKNLKVELLVKKNQAASLKLYQHQFQKLAQQWKNAYNQFATEVETNYLLDQVSRAGIICGLSFELFMPMQEINHSFYNELPINMTFLGQYQQLICFIKKITDFKKVVIIDDFEITVANQDKEYRAVLNGLIIKMMIKIYQINKI